MKKIFFIPFFISIFCISCNAKQYTIKEDYDSMSFEILEDSTIVSELPFNRFCGYQQVDNKFYFIDCLNSRITEYGEICFFDCNLKKIVYTKIYSGSSFYVSTDTNFLVVSSLIEFGKEYEIEDVFNIGINPKRQPLGVSIYNLNNFTKLKDFFFYDKIKNYDYSDLYISFKELPKNQLKINFGIYDSDFKIDCGILDLNTLCIK